MRFRKVKKAVAEMEEYKGDMYLKEYMNLKGNWNSIFENKNPIKLEIGMGRGKFLIGMAEENENINYLGMDKLGTLLLKPLKRIEDKKMNNIRIFGGNAIELEDIFEENELDELFLNFSDPWPKDRHFKRRLTYKGFLEKYARVLKNGGRINFKTDNDALFDFSMEEIRKVNAKIIDLTYDLHEERAEKIFTTEYEDKFKAQGIKIKRVIFELNKNICE